MYRIISGFELPEVLLNKTENHVAVIMEKKHSILSSAVLNGGSGRVRSILNMRVKENFRGECSHFESPETTLSNYRNLEKIPSPVAGMMTSADLDYCRSFTAIHEKSNHRVAVVVTAGLSNARAAGDNAEYREVFDIPVETGTINIILGTTLTLSPAAQSEALMIITEAKTALLHSMNELSKISNYPATGTGTDSVAVFSPENGEVASFCGKHTILGEMIARLVKKALHSSLAR